MTIKDKSLTIELLRCAADLLISKQFHIFPRLDAIKYLGYIHTDTVVQMMYDACTAVGDERTEIQLLEAAQRIEEGSWP